MLATDWDRCRMDDSEVFRLRSPLPPWLFDERWPGVWLRLGFEFEFEFGFGGAAAARSRASSRSLYLCSTADAEAEAEIFCDRTVRFDLEAADGERRLSAMLDWCGGGRLVVAAAATSEGVGSGSR